jgi:hypothetical protein
MNNESGLRRHDRDEKSSPIQMVWKDRTGVDRYVVGRSLDISASGMRIEIADAIESHTYVTISCTGLGLQGSASVRSCTRKGMKFIAGLEFSGLVWRHESKKAS